MSKDTIYRQDAIDAVADGLKRVFVENRDVAEILLKSVPSAQPEPIKINIDHELTKDEYERLRKDMADAPIVLFSSAQPEIILCKDCKQFQDHRCVKANHYVSKLENCMDVFGAERREE